MRSERNSKRARGDIRHRIETWSVRSWCCSPPRACPMISSPRASICRAKSSASGGNDFGGTGCRASRNCLGAGRQPAFPPRVVVAVKALACELPARRGLPLARWSLPELQREVVAQGLVAKISGATLWRWLSQDALRPWRHRSWIFPRDPAFATKAERILDLYAGHWDGVPLRPPADVLF